LEYPCIGYAWVATNHAAGEEAMKALRGGSYGNDNDLVLILAINEKKRDILITSD
jgi:hypothetical protein